MEWDKGLDSSEFLVLFIRILQNKMASLDNNDNMWMANWNFRREDLEKFILLSKSDYRYQEFLKGFNFNGERSIDYSVAVNYALNRHLITVETEGICYISRSFTGIMRKFSDEEQELMQSFVDDFLFFSSEPTSYMSVFSNFLGTNEMRRLENDLSVQTLIREINHREIVDFLE